MDRHKTLIFKVRLSGLRPIYANGLLCGYVELKATGKGAKPSRYKGHDKDQWERFKNLPNILYTDGNEWALYRDGKAVKKVMRLAGDVALDGPNAVEEQDALSLLSLFRNFVEWEPIIPKSVRQLAQLLAPLCRMLRDDVVEALKNSDSPLNELASDWRDCTSSKRLGQELVFANGHIPGRPRV
ncbi:MAG: hypothetical protein K9K66_08965 [Desulfarculaceae bacterium]|nr:hypothetical protein [Desulfarculaceae bacterium]MCF8073138.1 hypothetical protein [Desulfarculaceae bacterium]MCF8101777.1 hypothetical protein [Desulfarculaceae bacterium]MCF8117341.1 hypothetical protein [Desulfarculaceae bacterium]